VLHSSFFAGSFCRWLALTSAGTSLQAAALENVEQMGQKLQTFDALDQVEILCAAHFLHFHFPQSANGSSGLIRERLNGLPAAVTEQLVRLGVMAR